MKTNIELTRKCGAEIMTNIYAKRDHEALGQHYLRHIDRLTIEGLHSKSAIAGELAHRDAANAALRKDAGRLDWLANNPVEALDIFGHTRPGEAREVRIDIDAAMAQAVQP